MKQYNKYDQLSDKTLQVTKLLIEFIDVAAKGLTKPYDHTSFIEKMKKAGASKMLIDSCCPPSADVHDSKDLKPYLIAATEEVFNILDLQKKEKIYE